MAHPPYDFDNTDTGGIGFISLSINGDDVTSRWGFSCWKQRNTWTRTYAQTQVMTKWQIDVFFLTDVIHTRGWKCRTSLLQESVLATTWSFTLNYTHTHTHTWQGAASWLVGWLTLACQWLSVLPSRWDCCSLLLTLIVWNNPVAHLRAHLSASYSQTSLTINNYVRVCVCACVSLCVRVCISVPLTS